MHERIVETHTPIGIDGYIYTLCSVQFAKPRILKPSSFAIQQTLLLLGYSYRMSISDKGKSTSSSLIQFWVCFLMLLHEYVRNE